MSAHFGLDIGSTSIKLIDLNGDKAEAVGIAANPIGKVGVDLVHKEKLLLAEEIKKLISESKVRKRSVVVSVPESLTFTRIMQFPVMSSPELASAIKWELDQIVPYPPDQIETSWVIMEKPNRAMKGEKMKVLVVAVPSRVSNAYVDFMALVGLEPIRLENESLSLVRGLLRKSKIPSPVLIIDMGASCTKMVIADNEKIYSVHVMPVAGLAYTRLISQTFSLPITQAEQYKRTYGIDENQVEGKINQAVQPLLSSLVSEIIKVMAGYKEVYKDSQPLNRVMLTGGSAYMVGLLPYLVKKVNIEVVLGDVFEKIKVPENLNRVGAVFSQAVGLATE